MQVAIDGPAGSGKSTVCKIVAERYGLIYLDTGAMYRSIAYLAIKFKDESLSDLASGTEFCFSDNGRRLSIEYKNKTYDVTESIRTPEVSGKVSEVAADKSVRLALTKKQQSYALSNDVIMEGRDITTVVLPNADVKMFLTASPEERAKRRFTEWGDKKDRPSYDEVLKKIIERDEADIKRTIAPLKIADDAEVLDTTGLTLQDVADRIGLMIEKATK